MAEDKMTEAEARLLVLRILADQPDGQASMAFVKEEIPEYYPLTAADMEPSSSRKNEQHWQQIVGNVVSHKTYSTSIFYSGFAEYDEEEGIIKITETGKAHLGLVGR